MLIDTHAHLSDPLFDNDLSEVLARARSVGVEAVITVGETLCDARKILELSKLHRDIKPAAGLYPTYLEEDQAAEVELFIRQNHRKLAAIGEVGLDYWKVKNEGEREVQREIFTRFIDLSAELDLPLNIHSQSAGRQTINLLLDRDARRIQMHAFDGKSSTALPAVEAGYFFSIPPSIVRSRQKQKLVKHLPLSCLLLETDSPVLGTDPSQRNEPANLVSALKVVAELKGITEDEVVERVGENTVRLYGDIF